MAAFFRLQALPSLQSHLCWRSYISFLSRVRVPMENRIFFKGKCPRCKKDQTFNIINVSCENESLYAESFKSDSWREYDYELFSITSNCNACKHFVSGTVAAIWDESKNCNAMLSDFAAENGEIKQDENIFVEFDVPPLIPQQHMSSPPVVDMHFLYEQANRCYDIHAWDAVVILCRKIVDIQSLKMWRKMYDTQPKSNLCDRVRKILLGGKKLDENILIEDQLDFSKENHVLLYNIESVRFLGNFAAHNELYVNSEDAEAAILYTRNFMDAYYKWSNKFNASEVEIQ